VLFDPLHRRLERWCPRLGETTRRQIAGIAATLLLILAIVIPIGVLLLGIFGPQVIWDLATVLFARGEAAATAHQSIVDHLMGQIDSVRKMYPSLSLDREAIQQWLGTVLTQASDFRSYFLDWLFTGGGGLLITTVLAFLLLPNFYAQGGRGVLFLLHYTPLSKDQCQRLGTRHRQIVLRLLNDSVATALVRGMSMGLIIWLCTDLNLWLVAMVGSFISLVPVIGQAMVWLPLVALQWSIGNELPAIILGFGCLLANMLITWARRRVGRKIDDESDWLGFILFLGLVGGILTYGVKGFVIGPLIVVLTVLLARYFLPLYGIGGGEGIDASDVDEAEGDSSGR